MEETARPARTSSIDLLRGGVMVLMALDHARDFFFGFRPDPTDLATTSVVLFFTRWVTHFCAPVFVFLAGTSAFFYGRRHGASQTARFLLTRGAWLILLELTVVHFGWLPDPAYHLIVLQVIWAIGAAMIVLAGLSRLPLAIATAVGAVLVAGHNLLDFVDRRDLGWFRVPWKLLHEQTALNPAPDHQVFIVYPLLPWFGVIALGYAFGSLYEKPPDVRRRFTLRLGIVATLAFVVLRAINVYGDPAPWQAQPRGVVFTALSFLNCTKYPPSLLYVLMTVGPALLCLLALERVEGSRVARPIEVFGRVPLLFYVAHVYLLRYTSAPIAFARFGADAFEPPPGRAGSAGLPLFGAYAAWIIALFILFPLCRWFAAQKARRREWWLSYL